MKSIHVFIFLSIAPFAHAVDVVVDPTVNLTTWINDILIQVKQDTAYAKEVMQYETQLQQYESQLLALARAGDPAQLKSLPAVRDLTTLEAIYGQVRRDYADINRLASPSNFQNNIQTIMASYKLPAWNGATINGMTFQPQQADFQFSTSSYNVAQTVQEQIQTLQSKRADLQTQRDIATQSLQSATDNSAVAKLHATISALSAGIADINQGITQIFQQGQLANTQTQAAKEISQAQTQEQVNAAVQAGAAQDGMQIPSGGWRTTILWDTTK